MLDSILAIQKRVLSTLKKNSIAVAATIFLASMTGLIVPQQFYYFNTAEAGEAECIDYDQSENTIAINCDASFVDVVQAINDPEIVEDLGNGEYILNANLEVADGVTFEMTSSSNDDNNLQYLKIADETG